MNFLLPWGLLGLLALLPILALYFLKLKRDERIVPSALLWKKVIEDLHVNAPFQRLRYSLLLLLQLLLVAVLAFALARPFLAYAGTRGRATVLLVDTSASMGTKDGSPDGRRTRLEQAVLDAQTKIDEMDRAAEMRIVAFDHEVRQLTPFTSDKVLLKEALVDLRPRDVGTQAQEALEAALALADERENGEVLLLSDGAFGRLDLQRLLGEEGRVTNLENLPLTALKNKLRFVPYGKEETDNVGVTRIGARTRSYREKETEKDKIETQLFVQIENFSSQPVDTILTLALEGFRAQTKVVKLQGRPIPSLRGDPAEEARALEAARSEEVFLLPDVSGLVSVRLTRADTVLDAFPLDNEAQAVIGLSEGTKILLVTNGNYFLEKAMTAMRDAIVAKRPTAAFQSEWDARGAASLENYDAVLFDGVAPAEWKDGGAVFLNVLPPLPGFKEEGQALAWPKTRILDWKGEHPVLRYVTFSNVLVMKARQWSVPKSATVLVEGLESPLAVCAETDRLRAVGVAFDLFESDWAYRLSLPLFLRNSALWASEVSPRRRPSALHTGEPLVIPPIATAPSGTLVRPDGRKEEITLSPERKTFVKGTDTAGLYLLAELPGGAEAQLRWAVNLADANESDNARRPALKLGDQELAATPTAIAAKREIWHWLALSAVGLLMIEWLVYHRRLGL